MTQTDKLHLLSNNYMLIQKRRKKGNLQHVARLLGQNQRFSNNG